MASRQPFQTFALTIISALIGAALFWIWTSRHPDPPAPDDSHQTSSPDPSSDGAPEHLGDSWPGANARGADPPSGDPTDSAPLDAGLLAAERPSPPDGKAPADPSAQEAPTRGSPGDPREAAGGDGAPGGGEPEGEGGTLSKETIRSAIRELTPSLKRCYEGTLGDFPQADGKVVIKFTIVGEGGQGHIDLEKIGQESTLHDSALHECMVEQIRGLTFPAPQDGEVSVTYPFLFNTGSREGEGGDAKP